MAIGPMVNGIGRTIGIKWGVSRTLGLGLNGNLRLIRTLSHNTSSSFGTLAIRGSRSFHSTTIKYDKRAELGSKILSKVPKFMKPYTINFVNRPVTNLVSFLILHELTAIVPLIGIWYVFYKYDISVPLDLPEWAINKGTKIIDSSLKSWDLTDFTFNDKFNLIMKGAYAYVIVKMLLPVRLMFSFLFTPLFTRFFVDPITGIFGRKKVPPPVVTQQSQPVKPKKIEKPRL
ncbi:hypothetical protein CLIB1444_02S03928 [[Candida] jaroonii]|uniref:Uncharacterized protein n=1 Tax=[Candida] jaroonii TaxID=467808 RepID=A0ACA9Y4C6_9ASCO|nr:hypothetical protein CLIB1444_02S03928 [[Candida] jaroonii]